MSSSSNLVNAMNVVNNLVGNDDNFDDRSNNDNNGDSNENNDNNNNNNNNDDSGNNNEDNKNNNDNNNGNNNEDDNNNNNNNNNNIHSDYTNISLLNDVTRDSLGERTGTGVGTGGNSTILSGETTNSALIVQNFLKVRCSTFQYLSIFCFF